MRAIVSCDYSKTPTRLPPPPRRVRANLSVSGRVIFGAYVGALLWAAGYFLLLAGTIVLGRDVAGHLTNVRTSAHRNEPIYYVDYVYAVDGVRHEGSAAVPQGVYWQCESALRHANPQGRLVTIRYFAFGPVRHEDFTPGSTLGTDVLIPVCAGLLLFIFRYLLCTRYRMLCRYGHATTGVVVRKYTRRSKNGMSYYVVYSYEAPGGRGTIEGKYECGRDALYKRAHVGGHVTVLYSAGNPRRSVPYELGSYVVVSAELPQADVGRGGAGGAGESG